MPHIIAFDWDHARTVSRRLLEVAAVEGDVKTVTTSTGVVAFDVSDEIANAAGFGESSAPAETPAETPAESDGEVKPPPTHGAGSGEAAWRKFLEDQDVDIPADATTRDALVDVWTAAHK